MLDALVVLLRPKLIADRQYLTLRSLILIKLALWVVDYGVGLSNGLYLRLESPEVGAQLDGGLFTRFLQLVLLMVIRAILPKVILLLLLKVLAYLCL